MWECATTKINHSQFPKYRNNQGVEVREVLIPMVALVATGVSKSIDFITMLMNCIVVCCHLWVAHRVPSVDGIFCEHFPWRLSRPHWYLKSYPGPEEFGIPCDDERHFQSGTVSFSWVRSSSLLIDSYRSTAGEVNARGGSIANINLEEIEA